MTSTATDPAVSIIMPAYNAQRFLNKAIESILAQTFTRFEFLILDDGSSDDTWAILQRYAQTDHRIRLFRGQNRGVAAALNFLLQSAQCDLVARMDADDVSHCDRIRQQVDYLQHHPHVGVLSTARRSVAPNGLAYCTFCPPEEHAAMIRLLAQGINPITHGSVMYRKSTLALLSEAPYQLTRVSEFEDVSLWKMLVKLTTFAVLPTPLYFKREYSGGLTARWHHQALDQSDRKAQILPSQEEPVRLDERVAKMLRKQLKPLQDYETYLNAIALFVNQKYIEAVHSFLGVAFSRQSRYRMNSMMFGVLALLGPLGLVLFRKIQNRPGNHYQF